jgi:hypothetical protein
LRFLSTETDSVLALLATTIVALLWAISPYVAVEDEGRDHDRRRGDRDGPGKCVEDDSEVIEFSSIEQFWLVLRPA